YHFYTKFIRPMPIILLVIFVYFYKKNLKSYNNNQKLIYSTLFLVILLISFLLNFPTGIDRLQTAVLYIPFIIIFTKLWEKPFMMQLTLLGGVLTVFEFLDKFRYFRAQEFILKINMNFLKKGHFDAYENFVRAIEIDFITYGYQLKGALLFFIPRFLWKDKPIGSGSTLANQLDYDFGGIAMPLIGEGYVNYGAAGSFLFMLLLGIILGNLDRMAWSLKNSNKDCLFLYYYYFLFGLVFYLMRGDLINSVAFISTMTASFWVLVLVLKYVAKLRI
ncbi:O-antigen polysaccharide polymerase Wzy, partial [bacterium]|nr:O-antigen polysaccharide polymerase Wzy [bacterium]